MKYYPDNRTTKFITHLPQMINLVGKWNVALTEIHIPMTFLHISTSGDDSYVSLCSRDYLTKEERRKIRMSTNTLVGDTDETTPSAASDIEKDNVSHGVYNDIIDLLDNINDMKFMRNHIRLTINCGGHVSVRKICIGNDCNKLYHILYIAPLIKKIVGFSPDDEYIILSDQIREYKGETIACLSRSLPQSMYVYSDVCESYITGDVHSPLMRVVPLDMDNYKYGGIKIKTFSAPLYIPLLHTKFQTIEMDIRDEYGASIPFEQGTLTVTLHFKRIE